MALVNPRHRRVEREGLGYALRMPDVATELLVGKIGTSRGELWGELTVSCALPSIASQTGHVFRGRFNLSSPTARSTMAKHLRDRTAGAELDWPEILELLCVGILSAEASGNPFERIGRMPGQIGPAFRLDPMLPLGKPTILFGDGGVGKSFFAVAVSVSVTTGVEVIPGFRPRTCPVLYLDWETDAADIDARIKAVSAGVGIEPPEIGYRASAGPLASSLEEIARYIASERVGLVVVDSMAGALGTASESAMDANESVIRLFTAVRHLDTTVLAIDHVSKEGARDETGAFKPYGSAYKVNLARSVWELRKGKDESDDATHLGLFHRKANNSRLHQPIGLAYHNEDGRRVWWTDEAITEASLRRGVSQRQRVWDALSSSSPMSDQEISEMTEIDVKNVRVFLSEGKKRGVYAKDLVKGDWSLAEVQHAS